MNNNLDVTKLALEESQVIDKFFKTRQIPAKVTSKANLPYASLNYGLATGVGVSPETLDKLLSELRNVIYNFRSSRYKLTDKVTIRVREQPLTLELSHPDPVTLYAQPELFNPLPKFTGLVGKSCTTKGKIEYINLETDYHILVGAMTGGGKSQLVTMALATMLFNTSPDDLKVLLIDLKNTDLVPFKKLSHCIGYAGTPQEAINMIQWLYDEVEQRKQIKPTYRLLLVFDEVEVLTNLAGKAVSQALDNLASIMNVGRSLWVNTMCATQHPKTETLGKINNFTCRFVGKVESKVDANTAAKRINTGAETFSKAGDFVRVQNGEIDRLKTFYMIPEVMDSLISSSFRTHGRGIASIKEIESKHIATVATATTTTKNETDFVGDLVENEDQILVAVAPSSTTNTPVVAPVAASSNATKTVVEPVERSSNATDLVAPEIADLAKRFHTDLAAGLPKRELARRLLGKEYVGSYARKLDKVIQYWSSTNGKVN